MERFRTAVVGCGAIAGTHLRYLRSFSDVELVGVCDTDTARREAAVRRFGIPAQFEDVSALIRDARPNVIHVLTPPGPAFALTQTALQHGCHVLVEKPMARTVDEARRMVETARAAGVQLGVDHSRLLHPSIVEARRYLERGTLGDLVTVEIVQGFTRAHGPRPWSYTYPWGIFDNLMPHCLYYARAFAGEAQDVAVRAWSENRIPESAFDELLVDVQGSRARARITLTLSTRPERNTVTLRGTKATVIVDTNLVTTVLVRDRALPAMVAKSIAAADPAWQLLQSTVRNTVRYAVGSIRAYPDIRNTLRAFYSALRGRNPLPATGEDGLAVVEMMERVRRLAEADLDGTP